MLCMGINLSISFTCLQAPLMTGPKGGCYRQVRLYMTEVFPKDLYWDPWWPCLPHYTYLRCSPRICIETHGGRACPIILISGVPQGPVLRPMVAVPAPLYLSQVFPKDLYWDPWWLCLPHYTYLRCSPRICIETHGGCACPIILIWGVPQGSVLRPMVAVPAPLYLSEVLEIKLYSCPIK